MMAEYRRPYTEQEVDQLERSADDIARLLHKPWATGNEAWRAMNPDTLSDLFYDALVALAEQMNREGVR